MSRDARFLGAADSLGAQLARDALWSGRRCNWLGDSMESVGGRLGVAHRTFGPELYSGTSGIALFLARLYALTQERVFATTARGAIEQALANLSAIPAPGRAGFYTGEVGVAYASRELAKILDDESLETRARSIVQQLAASELGPQGLDVLGGYAGSVPALLAAGRDAELELAVRFGEHLLDAAARDELGWSWPLREDAPSAPDQRNWTGFSHGAGGVAWAFLELHVATGDERFLEASRGGFEYELNTSDAQPGNGLAEGPTSPVEPAAAAAAATEGVAWCHGAAGIGLARCAAWELTGEEAFREQARAACVTTARAIEASLESGRENYSLCHGVGGNAELLLHADDVLGDDSYRDLAERVGLTGIERHGADPARWSCGLTAGHPTPGLMLGLAGIGSFYLRLHDSQRVPSIAIVRPRSSSACLRAAARFSPDPDPSNRARLRSVS